MKVRNGFVSNSSSSSFVIPKKYLSKDDYEIYDQLMWGSDDYDTELHESENYIFGKVSYHNKILQKIMKPYANLEGVDFDPYE